MARHTGSEHRLHMLKQVEQHTYCLADLEIDIYNSNEPDTSGITALPPGRPGAQEAKGTHAV